MFIGLLSMKHSVLVGAFIKARGRLQASNISKISRIRVDILGKYS